MQKIMFNDKYGLTQAVLEGRKTMTRRRIVPPRTMEGKDVYGFAVVKYPRTNQPIEVMALDADGAQIGNIISKYKVGEVVAVAQAYKYTCDPALVGDKSGWNNKLFVRADLMPHQICITDIQIMRLQDISDQDCIREGIEKDGEVYSFNDYEGYKTPRNAFAELIDRVSGKGTWLYNPLVFVYEFELVR